MATCKKINHEIWKTIKLQTQQYFIYASKVTDRNAT